MSSRTLLYEKGSSGSDLYFTSSITHSILMKEMDKQLQSVDTAKDKLQGHLNAEQRRRADSAGQKSSPAAIIRKPLPSVIKPRSASHLAPKAQSAQPPTSQPNIKALKSLGASDSEEKRVKDITASARYPFIHFLAVNPRTRAEVLQQVKVPEDVGKELLRKYAREARRDASRLELIDLCYKSLDIWAFPYASDEDRKAAQDNARQAFDRMRIAASDTKIWDQLLPEKDRGKGICLSQSAANNPKPGVGLGIAADHRKMLAGAGGESASRPKSKGTSNLMRIANGKKALKPGAAPVSSSASSPQVGAKKSKSPEEAKNVSSKKANTKEFKSAELISEEDDMDIDAPQGLIIEEPKAPSSSARPPSEAAPTDSSSQQSKKRKAVDPDGEDDQPRPPQKRGDGIAKRIKTASREPKPASAAGTPQVKQAATERKTNGVSAGSKKDAARAPANASPRDPTSFSSGNGAKERPATPASKLDEKVAKHKRTESLASNESKPSPKPSPKLPSKGDRPEAAGQNKASSRPPDQKLEPKPTKTAANTNMARKPASASTPSSSKPAVKSSPSVKPGPFPKGPTPSAAPPELSSGTATSRPSTSGSSSKPSPKSLIEEYKSLQPTHRKHLRASLYLHLTISLLPTDLMTGDETARFQTARDFLQSTETEIKTLLKRMTHIDLTTISSPWTSSQIAELSAKDDKYLAGRGLEPWILLPENHKAIVDEVVGFREFAAKRLQVLKGEYKKERGRLDTLTKGGEEWKALRNWLCEKILVVRQVEGLLS